MRLRLKEGLKAGREVMVSLTPPGYGREFKLLGVVVWCVAASDGTQVAGIRFDTPLNFSVVQDLGRQSTL